MPPMLGQVTTAGRDPTGVGGHFGDSSGGRLIDRLCKLKGRLSGSKGDFASEWPIPSQHRCAARGFRKLAGCDIRGCLGPVPHANLANLAKASEIVGLCFHSLGTRLLSERQ
jgi:hypothetical protein